MEQSLEERLAELREERSRGGSWMARRAVEALLQVAGEGAATTEELIARLDEAGRALASTRPAVGSISGAVGRLLAAAHGQAHLPPDELRRLVQEEGEGLIAARDRAARSIAIQLRPQLENAFVLTHSASATVREALLYTPPEHVVCTVSAPFEEGRAFARELAEAGLDVELVEDADALEALERASLLLLGADTVYRDGALCNKVGTARLAWGATDLRVPTVVACEVLKLVPVDLADGPGLAGETRSFDITPPDYVDLIVTEEGTFSSGEIHPVVERIPFLREGFRLLHDV